MQGATAAARPLCPGCPLAFHPGALPCGENSFELRPAALASWKGYSLCLLSLFFFQIRLKTEIRMTRSEQRSHDCFPKSQDISPCILAIFQLGKLPSASLNTPCGFNWIQASSLSC